MQDVESEDVSQKLGEQDLDCSLSVRQNVFEEEFEGNEFEEGLVTDYGTDGDEDSLDSHSVYHNVNYQTEIDSNL